ncbi:MAG: flagellar assembly protein FliW [Actinomycetota bacterium]|nr:flagellar assembly protein FliW [Actinomycetota bacterium]
MTDPAAPGAIPDAVETTRFGRLAVDPETVIRFPDGIPGFAELRAAIIVPSGAREDVVWLQSVERGDLAFLAALAGSMFLGYAPVVEDEDCEQLHLTSADDAMVLCLLSVDGDAGAVTGNLRAPIIVNTVERLGRQVILTDEDLPIRAPVGAGA